MAQEEWRKLYPLAPIDWVLEDFLGIPGTRTILPPTPADVLKALGIPTLGMLAEELRKRVASGLERK